MVKRVDATTLFLIILILQRSLPCACLLVCVSRVMVLDALLGRWKGFVYLLVACCEFVTATRPSLGVKAIHQCDGDQQETVSLGRV